MTRQDKNPGEVGRKKKIIAQIRPSKDSKSGDHESRTDTDRMKLLRSKP